ncbi:MAG: TraB domain-containing protein [Nanoarchaeota archaeon]|nr:TraB domain-containing protein [Nanoarchaeota archaeon]
MIHKNIIFIGTSHISKESILEIKLKINQEKPDIITVELDKRRYYALKNNQHQKQNFNLKTISKIGLKGYLFLIIGQFIQKKLGSIVNIEPGSDMLEAIKLCEKNNIQLELIDRDIEKTLKRFSQKISWREKITLIFDLFKGFFLKNKNPNLNFNLEKVPKKEIIEKLLIELKIRYPNIYEVLIEERNNFMAKKLFKLSNENSKKKILCIIGAGHESGIIDYLMKFQQSNITFLPD